MRMECVRVKPAASRRSRLTAGLVSWLLVGLLLAGCDLLDDAPPPRQSPVAGRQSPVATPALSPRSPALPSPTRPPATPTVTPTVPTTPTPSPTPTVSPTPSVSPTPAPTRTPRPAASGYRRFTSSLFPYAIDYLESWRGLPSGAIVGEARADLFAGETHGGITNSVTVFSQAADAGTTSDTLLESTLAALAEEGVTPNEEEGRTIDGIDAFVFSFTITRNERTYAVRQAVWVRQGFSWIVTMTTSPEEEERLRPVFNHMLDSFVAAG